MPRRPYSTTLIATVVLAGATSSFAAPPPDKRPARSRPEVARPAPPPTDDELELARRREAAVALATQAQDAFRERRFGAAAELFDRAYLQVAEENFLWNAGQAYERAGELKLARERYSSFLG